MSETIHGAGSLPPPTERLIFALDVTSDPQARELVERLGDAVTFYKLGLGLLTHGDYFGLTDWLAARGHALFADLKFHDIPATVASAVGGLRGRGIRYVTVHSDPRVMRAAVEAAEGDIGVLAVTVLTSLDLADLQTLGHAVDSVQALVLGRARLARACGCAGVIASGQEARAIRADLAAEDDACAPFRIVTPGVRPAEGGAGDQKRVVTPAEAFAAGADHIVVGRPIRDAADPRAAALSLQRTI
ncbi:MAG: orotidine-5'-phosphate decarboxylase, partial [Pseudomonadota bacterium]